MEHLKQGKAISRVLKLSTLAVSCMAAMNAHAAMDCTNIEPWSSDIAYTGGAQVQEANKAYKANWWTKGNTPSSHSGQSQEWSFIDDCSTGATNQPPLVSITSPATNAQLLVGDVVTLAADASDSDGAVTSVDFYLGTSLIGSSSQAPYSINWTAVAGDQVLKVIATDDKGEITETTRNFNVQETANSLPTVSLTVSASNIELGTSVSLNSTADDSDGSIDKVEYFANGSLIGTVISAPYTMDYTPAQSGSVTLFARATDNLGATSDSSTTSLIVNGEATTQTCRPDGLYQTEGITVPYCTIYDEQGREIMGADHPRRVIGYFTSWRSGDNPQAAYLVNDIPWEQLTHINYAFVSIGSDGKVNVGDVTDPTNPATGKEWPGVEIDPTLGFKGHFGALATYKKKYDVKTLISIGGWAETGGHFAADGSRIADGSFYTMTTNADGSINHAGIEKFANSAVDMMRQYQFDGLDIDYEYPTSMAGAGNPDDKAFMEPRRAYLWASYQELMKVLRHKLDQASAQDGIHYMLTIAAPSSGYLLRGMEDFDVTKYLDYVNIMSYDLHGAWNDHVGHNAALFDTGKDSELAQWNVYGTAAYGGIGYLNTDWAYHYFRGSMPAGRINIGVPYYTRGWQGVTGGENGLWGRAALT